ncbi:MAG: sugar phosphate isomerase/epimerase [Clostridia bacterium]|nr:sugar phosphate isomerase/epimerase [Clostridia bacterium]
MKVGVMLESLRKGSFREGVEAAAALGLDGIQVYCVDWSELSYNMSPEKAREYLDIVKSNGLVFSALCGDFATGFLDGEKNPEIVDKSKRVLEAAKMLECDVVTTHIGTLTVEETKKKEVARKALRELALFADSMGSAFAVETGPEMATTLCDFLDSLGAGGVRVNFDPANLVMVAGDRPETAVKTLGKYIVHTHAKDGIKLNDGSKRDINIVIGGEAKDHDALLGMGETYLELPLGEGDVNFDTYLPALASTGFDGFLTIEREVGANPEADIRMAVQFLREKLSLYDL